jgi:hypothetical protein
MITIFANSAETSILSPALVSAGISAFVSIAIFAFTQFWLYHKGRVDLLRSKLEELWKALIDIAQKTRPTKNYSNEFTEETAKDLNERATQLIESLLLPTPYVGLYFPLLADKYSRINHACGDLVKLMRNCPVTFEYNKSQTEIYTDKIKIVAYKKELQEGSAKAKTEISEMLEYLRVNQGMLIKTLKHVLIAKFDDWSGQ